jgi:hypothetical protein
VGPPNFCFHHRWDKPQPIVHALWKLFVFFRQLNGRIQRHCFVEGSPPIRIRFDIFRRPALDRVRIEALAFVLGWLFFFAGIEAGSLLCQLPELLFLFPF